MLYFYTVKGVYSTAPNEAAKATN